MITALRRKFVLITMALVSLVLLAVFVGIVLFYTDSMRQDSYRMLEQMLDRKHGDKGPDFQLGGKVPDGFGRDPVFVVMVDAAGAARLEMAERVEVDDAELQAIAAEVVAKGEQRGELPGYDLRYMAAQYGGEWKIAFTVITLERSQVGSVVTTTALAVAGALVVFLAASVLLARWALRPVEEAWRKQRRFVADASHELKTPITVILANAGILKAHPGQTVAEQMAWVDNTEQEARRMKGLVDDMLFLARGDDAQARAPLARTSLSDAVSTAALAFEPVAFEQGLALDIAVEEGLFVMGSEPQLKQLVGILLDNAIKYGQKGTTVDITLKRRQGQAELAVHNRGEAIGPEDQRHLFERFYQVDASRAGGGYGLGLSIAGAIVEGHRGKIGVESGPAGTTFRVGLPLR